MPTRPSHNVLVVEDEHDIRTMLGAALQLEGFDVRLAEGGAQGVEEYRARPADLVLLDVWMPGLDGAETLAALQELDPAVRCCFMTGQGGGPLAARLLALGALDVLLKPFRLDDLAATVRRLLGAATAAPVT
jgi:DNA-binding NtrC family response regulator